MPLTTEQRCIYDRNRPKRQRPSRKQAASSKAYRDRRKDQTSIAARALALALVRASGRERVEIAVEIVIEAGLGGRIARAVLKQPGAEKIVMGSLFGALGIAVA
jgi:hypothetical protein